MQAICQPSLKASMYVGTSYILRKLTSQIAKRAKRNLTRYILVILKVKDRIKIPLSLKQIL